MQHPDEGMIHTWLDGELPAEEAAALEAHVAECEQCKASVAEARGFIAASSRIVGALDNVPSGVIPIARPSKRMWYSSPQFRAAAAVLVVAGASLLVMRTGTQKATLSDALRPEAAEMAATRLVVPATPPAVANSAPVKPPVVADQAVAKVELAKPSKLSPAEGSPPKGFAVLSPPALPIAANKIAAKEEDFSGKGVKGGSSQGVLGGPTASLDTSAANDRIAAVALSGKVAGVAMKAGDAMVSRRDFRPTQPDLKLIRVDSAGTTKKSIYESASGSEVVLTEVDLAPAFAKVTGPADERKERAAPEPTLPPVVVNAPVAATVAQRVTEIHSISWVDSLTRRYYTLSGPVSVEELEGIKARLLKPKQ